MPGFDYRFNIGAILLASVLSVFGLTAGSEKRWRRRRRNRKNAGLAIGQAD
jgi:hypothetical protein